MAFQSTSFRKLLSIPEILIQKWHNKVAQHWKIVKRVDFALHLKVATGISDASVMFVRGMCISTLWSFQNQCRVNTFVLGTTSG